MKRIALAGLLIVGAALVNANGAEAAGGTAWKLQSTRAAALPSDSDFRGVACATSTMCIGVGSRAESPGFAFAERWDGKRWKLLSVSQPAGATWSTFSGVSCSSSSACTAVGSYIDGSGNVLTLAERWNGKSWVMQTTPSPGSYGPSLFGVSCSTGSDCAAVGAYQAVSGGPEVTLAEHWNGHTWTVQSTQNPTGAGRWSQLSEVSCSSPNACTAVGTFFDSSNLEHMVVERWNGTRWALQSPAVPAGFNQAWLSGVSCASDSRCTVVGTETSSTQSLTLAEQWDGHAWAIQSTPSGLSGELMSVSCTAATACTAVGTYQIVNGTSVTLAEVWDGSTWSIESIPSPAGRRYAELDGVSCGSATTCEATGISMNNQGNDFTLAEGNST